MWSLGVVLYIMLSGRHPFEKAGVPPEEVLQQIFDAQYVFDPDIWKAVSGRAQVDPSPLTLARSNHDPDP